MIREHKTFAVGRTGTGGGNELAGDRVICHSALGWESRSPGAREEKGSLAAHATEIALLWRPNRFRLRYESRPKESVTPLKHVCVA